MNHPKATITRLQNRLDKLALEQLRAEVNKLHAQVEAIKYQLDQAEHQAINAERLADLYLGIINENDNTIGIAVDGTVGLVESHQ